MDFAVSGMRQNSLAHFLLLVGLQKVYKDLPNITSRRGTGCIFALMASIFSE
jgi:hypothetical protein